MVKKYAILALVILLTVQMVQAVKYGRRFSFSSPPEVGHVPKDLSRCESTSPQDHAKMVNYLIEHGSDVKKKHALSTNPEANDLARRLSELTHDPEVKILLNNRFELTDETFESWKSSLAACLALFGAEIKNMNDHELMFRFVDAPGYNILMDVAGWPFAAYDTKEGPRLGFNCNFWCTPDCEYSPYEFPLHLVSRVLYAAEINSLDLPNVRAAQHWLFDFSEDPSAVLNDRDVFVVAENIRVDEKDNKDIAGELKEVYKNYTQEALIALTDDAADNSLMANLVRVIIHSGLWNIKPTTEDPVFMLGSRGLQYAIFRQVQRPSTGKPAFWFHDRGRTRPTGVTADGGREEIARDAGVGLSELVEWLRVKPAVSAPTEGGGFGAAPADE